MGVDLGGVWGKQKEVKEGELWFVCKTKKTFKIAREKKKIGKKKVFSAKPKDLSLKPQTPMVEGDHSLVKQAVL